jgi:hypothetical protein
MMAVIKALALTEMRLRLRRTSTLVTLAVVIVISWIMIADPASGSALIVVDQARVLYTSSALSVGSASLGCILFGLGGFYLVRGRVAEDVRSGTGSVIGATPVSNALFVFSRWLGSVAFFGALILAFMFTIMLLQAIRGDGAIEPLVYLKSYAVLLLPMVLFTVSCAALFDNWAPLLGKRGDLLFFVIWMAQIGVMPVIDKARVGDTIPKLELLDFNGIGSSMIVVTNALQSKNVSLGGGDFKGSVAPVTMTNDLWSAELLGFRFASALIALLPLLLSVAVFHRFSPDKIKVAASRKRRSPLAMLNGLLRPLSVMVAPLFTLAARVPGLPGQALGDVALTFVSSPSAIAALIASAIASLVAPAQALPVVMLGSLVFWGVLISDISTRDHGASLEEMTGALRGGVSGRYVRQFAATALLGLLFCGVVALRWSGAEPLRAAAVVAGMLSMAALATGFGRCSRTARLFMALFLFWTYIILNQPKMAMLDVLGFVGVANVQSIMAWAAAGALTLAAGYAWNRRSA